MAGGQAVLDLGHLVSRRPPGAERVRMALPHAGVLLRASVLEA